MLSHVFFKEEGTGRFDYKQRRRSCEDGAKMEDADFEDWSEAKECWQLPETGKVREWIFPLSLSKDGSLDFS